jgi:CubicO group peptidase (beta-lactamase class C family)
LPAAPIDRPVVDAIVQDALKAFDVPGAAVAIIQEDNVVYLAGRGVRKLGHPEPVTPDTIFAIGSCTKAFTATAIALLADEGKMNWDDPVRKHLLCFRLADPLADRDVTIRDLLCHRTGVGGHNLLWLHAPWTIEETIRRTGLVEPSHSFRSTYDYNNIMYLAAGQAIGAASHSAWHDFVQRRLFDPLGMGAAVFTSSAAQKAPDHASPHRRRTDGKVQAVAWYNDDQQIRASGSIKASARDLGNWVRLQLGEGIFNGKRIVSTANLTETRRAQIVERVSPKEARELGITQRSYGLGWHLEDYHGRLMVEHGGAIEGFRAQVMLLPAEKLGIVVLSNLHTPNEAPAAIAYRLVDLILGLPAKDWNGHFLNEVKNAEAARKAREQQRTASRHVGTGPSHELSAYAATYEEPAYGKVTIALEKGSLLLRWSRFQIPLEHFHFDTFIVTGRDALEADPLDKELVLFALGPDGEPDTLKFLGRVFKRLR